MLLLITNTLPGPSASEVTTLWRYINILLLLLLLFYLCNRVQLIFCASRWRHQRVLNSTIR